MSEDVTNLDVNDRVPDHPSLPDEIVGRRIVRLDEDVPVTEADRGMGHASPCTYLAIDGVPRCVECGRAKLDLDVEEGSWA